MSKALNRGSDRATGGTMVVNDLSLVPSGSDHYVLVKGRFTMLIPCSKAQLPAVEEQIRRIYRDNVQILNKKPTDLFGEIVVCPASQYGG